MKGKLYYINNEWIVKFQDVWTADNRAELYENQLPLSPDTHFGFLRHYKGEGEEIEFEQDFYYDSETRRSINVAVLIPIDIINESDGWMDIVDEYNGAADLWDFVEYLQRNYEVPSKINWDK